MPLVKVAKKSEPLWKAWDYAAQKRGPHHTVFWVNGDRYTGEWQDDMKHGKGTYIWKDSGHRYDGGWEYNKRSGFGTLSYPNGKGGFFTKYSGDWLNDKRHYGPLAFRGNHSYLIIFPSVSGLKKKGYGMEYYSQNEMYEGEWCADKRCGWGRMFFSDGSTYEGEWCDDKQCGPGMMQRADRSRYEGSWSNGLKNGPGKFYLWKTGQIMEGVWVDGIPKCDVMRDFDRESAPEPTQYPIPAVELVDPDAVVAEAEEMFLQQAERKPRSLESLPSFTRSSCREADHSEYSCRGK